MAKEKDLSKIERKEIEKRIRRCFENKSEVFGSSAFASLTDGSAQIAAMFMMNNPYVAGVYALAKTSGPVSGELRASASTYSSEKMMNNVAMSMANEYDKMPHIEKKARNVDQVNEDIGFMAKYGSEFIGTMNRIYTSYAGLALATVPIMLQNPSLSTLGAAGISMATSFGVTSYLSKQRRQATQGQEDTINYDRTLNRAYQKQYLANSHWREANRVSEKEKEKIVEKQKNIYKKLGSMLKSAMKHWGGFSAGLGINIGVGVAAYYGLGETAASLKSVALPIMTSTLMFAASSSYINAVGDKVRTLNMFGKTYQRFKHKEEYELSYGNQKLSEKDNVIKLSNVAYNLRHSHNDEAHEIKAGNRFKNPLFENTGKDFYLESGITVLGGASGAGKSTLIDLITRGDDVSQGNISFGHYNNDGKFTGKNIKDLEQGGQWNNVAIAFQKPDMLINATVREYITCGNPNASEELIEKVSKVVRISKDGIDPDKIMSENNLSEGEKKRIGLAQVLISDKPIMILDEPTSGVDASTAKRIIDYLNDVKKDKTIIYTTHNPEELRHLSADKALDLDKDAKMLSNFYEKFDKSVRAPSTISSYNLKDPEKLNEYIALSKDRNKKTEEVKTSQTQDRLDKIQSIRDRINPNKIVGIDMKALNNQKGNSLILRNNANQR